MEMAIIDDVMTQSEQIIEQEIAFTDQWYKQHKGMPTYADAIAWANRERKKEFINKACDWLEKLIYQEYGGGPFERMVPNEVIEDFKKAMGE